MAIQNIKHWHVGDVHIARIVEVNAFEDNISMLLPDATPEFVQQFPWMVPHFATPDGRMILSFQAFVLRSQGKNIMIDTCIGADRKREFDVFCNMQTSFMEDLVAAGFPPESVSLVLCTHLHFDHVGWNTRLVDGKWVPTFKNARYLFGRAEYAHWQHLKQTHGYHDLEHLTDAVEPIVEAGLVDYIEPSHQLTEEVSIFPTPGHTPGHVSVLIRSRGQEAVITGDLMHHPIQLEVPDAEVRFDMDKPQGARTRRSFVQRFADTPTLIIGSHFSDPTSGHIVSNGKAYKLDVE